MADKKPLTPADVAAMQARLDALELENEKLKSGAPVVTASDSELADNIVKLEAENKILREQALGHADALQKAQDDFIARQSAFLLGSNVSEISKGENEDGEEIWQYKVELPPSGGEAIRINGINYYHGETYDFTTDQLRSVKDIVARCWQHESEIMGSNENFYRKPTNVTLRGGQRRH